MPDHLAFLMMATIMLLVLLLMGLTIFAFSDPTGFFQTFVPIMKWKGAEKRSAYIIGSLCFMALIVVCFVFGALFSCLSLEMLSCPLYPWMLSR